MKSKTYQKEGWFILEEENSVFGFDAENTDKLDSEKNAIFIIENKEEIQNKTEVSSKALTDFFDSVTDDLPEPSKEEIDSGIVKILERTHPETVKSEPTKKNKSKKVTFRVLFIAALLSVLSFSCLFVMGNSHNISIENGFVTFTKDTIKVVFFDEAKKEFISVDTLLIDLETHGYENILFPEEFTNNYDSYKVSVPVYIDDDALGEQVSFDVYSENKSYAFFINKYDSDKKVGNYMDVDNASTLKIDNVYVYIFEFESGLSTIEYFCEEYRCSISAHTPYSEMVKLAETLK